ncbi:MAG: Fur family transcriptional regulator [Bosea sp. (in: a-proteobacteria)]
MKAEAHLHDHSGADHHAASCRHAANHAGNAATLLDRAETRCKQAGSRLTAIRRKVLEALLADHRPLGAYDIADRISPPAGRRVAPISIYRALDFLVEHGFVHRLSTRNAYVACPHEHAADEVIAFLICETCGGVDEDGASSLQQAMAAVAKSHSFSAQRQVVEITGLCEHCQGGHRVAVPGR